MEHSITIAIVGSFSFSWEKTSLTSFHFIMILSDIIIIVIPSMTFNKLNFLVRIIILSIWKQIIPIFFFLINNKHRYNNNKHKEKQGKKQNATHIIYWFHIPNKSWQRKSFFQLELGKDDSSTKDNKRKVKWAPTTTTAATTDGGGGWKNVHSQVY